MAPIGGIQEDAAATETGTTCGSVSIPRAQNHSLLQYLADTSPRKGCQSG